MAPPPPHLCRVLAAPWPGVHATDITSGRHFARHWHDSYGVGLMDDGAHRSASGHGAVEAQAGDVVCTNPGEVHDGRPLGGPLRRWRTVYLPAGLVAALQGEPGGAAQVAFTAPAFRDPEVRAALLRLLAALQAWNGGATTDAARLACEEALVEACGLMLARHSTAAAAPAREDPALQRVLERLADESLPAPRLDELATLAAAGRFQLLRQFRRRHGTTPHAWWLQHRVERARQRIAAGCGLAEAAAAGGFVDQSHLHRAFVQRFGFTPGAWRRATAQ